MATVSLAVMVRDDAVRLKRCLESAKNAVDQVVVLDTGSNDDSISVARSEGAVVHEIEWPNNFSTALNVLLEKVETDWILRLDSDEWFEQEPSAPLREVVEDESASAAWITRRDIQPGGGFEEIALVRLWRRHPSLRYQGVVHENIPLASIREAWPDRHFVSTGLWFWHDGYGGGHRDKIARNVGLLEREVEANPSNPYYQAMLAKGYADLHDARARSLIETLVRKAVEEDEPGTPVLASVLAEYFQGLGPSELNDSSTNRAIQKALQWFGASPAVLVSISNLELRRGNREAAFEVLLVLERLATSGEYDRTLPVNPALFGKQFWKHLDRLADQLGRYEVCKRCEPYL